MNGAPARAAAEAETTGSGGNHHQSSVNVQASACADADDAGLVMASARPAPGDKADALVRRDSDLPLPPSRTFCSTLEVF